MKHFAKIYPERCNAVHPSLTVHAALSPEANYEVSGFLAYTLALELSWKVIYV